MARLMVTTAPPPKCSTLPSSFHASVLLASPAILCPIGTPCHALSVILPLTTGMLPTLDFGPTPLPIRATMSDKTLASEALAHGY